MSENNALLVGSPFASGNNVGKAIDAKNSQLNSFNGSSPIVQFNDSGALRNSSLMISSSFLVSMFVGTKLFISVSELETLSLSSKLTGPVSISTSSFSPAFSPHSTLGV